MPHPSFAPTAPERSRLRSWPLLAAWLGAALLSAVPHGAVGAPMHVPQGHRLVWSDEFDTDGLPDPARWVHDTVRNKEGWHNEELQYYSAPRAENAVVRGGRLVITARRESLSQAPDWGGQKYTSARLITRGKAEWTYGFFEVRARMPCGKGTWPAIWTLGSGGRWPEDGELDIMEHVGKEPQRVSSAVHVKAAHGANPAYGAQLVPTACTAFHDYQMLWTPEGVSFGVDGFVHMHYPRHGDRDAWPFDRPQYLLLNLAIGGHLGGAVDDTIFPVSLEVEHVRVYQRAP